LSALRDLAVRDVPARVAARREGHISIVEQVYHEFARADFRVHVARFVITGMSVKPNRADRYRSHASIITQRLGFLRQPWVRSASRPSR